MDFSDIRFISFDCYGTLIDWEAGIVDALRPVFAAHQVPLIESQLLRQYAELEREAEKPPYRRYRNILAGIVRKLGEHFGFIATQDEESSLPDSLANWLPFPDTVDALQCLGRRFQVGILSNVDDDLFAGTFQRLKTDFAVVVTAQQVESYKPSLRNFELMRSSIEALGIEPHQWLHVAQSRAHDIVPARQLGIANVWVNRPARYGASAVTEASVEPDLEVNSLAALASLMQPAG